MNEKVRIKAEHKEFLEKIKKHSKKYFTHDNPEISDYEFDEIKKKALELEYKYPFLKKNISVNDVVGSKPSISLEKLSI